MENIAVGITGASGVVYAQRLLQVLLTKKDIFAHVSISEAALRVIHHELGIDLDYEKPNFEKLLGSPANNIAYYNNSNISTTIASSQYPVKAMVIVPCSMNTLCSVANGIASNLIQRVASVTIKERRTLILVPRETPLSSIHLEAMLKLSSVGTCILPAMPGFYHNPKTLNDQVDFVVAKILDMLGIKHLLIPVWKGENDRIE
ncbi:MAG: UbiX family flavin prenyltransferase [Planctomycetes bacterium]|nr:UbiX family flavin prenyltransferase [Planctomycetota bacterium]